MYLFQVCVLNSVGIASYSAQCTACVLKWMYLCLWNIYAENENMHITTIRTCSRTCTNKTTRTPALIHAQSLAMDVWDIHTSTPHQILRAPAPADIPTTPPNTSHVVPFPQGIQIFTLHPTTCDAQLSFTHNFSVQEPPRGVLYHKPLTPSLPLPSTPVRFRSYTSSHPPTSHLAPKQQVAHASTPTSAADVAQNMSDVPQAKLNGSSAFNVPRRAASIGD